MPRIDAGGVELFYESLGEGLPLVLQAHHHINWMMFQAPYFSQHYQFITFDRRGTGRSAAPEGDWSISDFAQDLKNLLDALEIDQAIIGGASLGGVITCQFGLDYPERARALIIGHTVPYLWPLASVWIDEQIAAIDSAEQPIRLQPRSYDWEAEGPPTRHPALDDSVLGHYLPTLATGLDNDPESAKRMIRSLGNWDIRPRYAELNALDIPALVIVGGHEPQKTIELSYEWHQQIPGSEFSIMPDSFHSATIDDPVGWNARVHDFLVRHGL